MAAIAMGRNRGKSKPSYTTHYDYDYPNGLKLRPGSELHDDLVSEVIDRAQDSWDQMSKRHPHWRLLDRTMTSYIREDEVERLLKDEDEREPISIVIPFSYATLETLLTYQVATFLQDPIFQYEPFEPGDTINAILLESLVRHQSIWAKMGLNIHTMLRDQLMYGFGSVTPGWTIERGWRTRKQATGSISALTNMFRKTGENKVREEAILYEGGDLTNIDPYSCLPDPNVSIHEVKKGEFFGYIDHTNYHELIQDEAEGEFFNVKYLKDIDARTSLFTPQDDRDVKYDIDREGSTYTTNPVDIIPMYIKIIPSDWDLGDSDYPEIWKFVVAGDTVLIGAEPLNMDYNTYPIVIDAPDFDGYSITPTSRMEIVYGMQDVLNWMVNSHVLNVRKTINDMLVVDPFMINIADLRDPDKAGKIIRLRRAAWGRGVKDAVHQLQVQDVTKQHIKDSGFLVEMMQQVTAAVDSVMGVMRTSGERRSATESRGATMGALSRLERSAKVSSIMAMHDLAYMLAVQTQQLMSEERYVQIVGRNQEILLNEYGVDSTRVPVSPLDILVDFDVVPKDGSNPRHVDTESMIQMFQVIAANEGLAQKFDMFRMFEHIARGSGATNIQDFRAKGGSVGIGSDQDVEREAGAGNLIDIKEAMNG